jgi:hypothetical protein
MCIWFWIFVYYYVFFLYFLTALIFLLCTILKNGYLLYIYNMMFPSIKILFKFLFYFFFFCNLYISSSIVHTLNTQIMFTDVSLLRRYVFSHYDFDGFTSSWYCSLDIVLCMTVSSHTYRFSHTARPCVHGNNISSHNTWRLSVHCTNCAYCIYI